MEWRKMRRFKQQVSEEECVRILSTEKRAVLSMHGENGYPYSIPINFYYDQTDGKIYFHGAGQGNKIDLLKKDNKVCFCTYNQGFVREGEWAYNATSVIAFGRISELTDPDEIVKKCRLLGRKYYPDAASVEVEIEKAISRVHMLVMTIDHMTGKLVNES